MNKTILIVSIGLVVLIGILVVASYSPDEDPITNPADNNMNTIEEFILSSPAFASGASIPVKYSCDGDNLSPPLRISGSIEDAQSFALIMDDPDIPQEVIDKLGKNSFDHWVVFNIPTSTTVVAERTGPPGVLGLNDREELGYVGPCPPYQEHRYIFKLYALDSMLELAEGARKSEVLDRIQGKILAETELIGRYERTE